MKKKNVYLVIVSVLLSLKSLSQFGLPENITIPNSNQPFFISVDLNGDLKEDLITTSNIVPQNTQLQISICTNHGFTLKQTINIQNATYNKIKAIDINNDNLIDITAYCTQKQKIVYFENFGNCEYGAEEILISSNLQLNNFNFCDFDNDNLPELIYEGIHEYVINKNLGFFVFGDSVVVDTYTQSTVPIKCTDMNNDGLNDFCVVRDSPNNTYLYLNQGNLTFTSQLIQTSINTTDIELVDINNDGKTDIVTYDDTVKLHKNLGNGNFDIPQTIIPVNFLSTNKSTFGDVDADGDLDFLYFTSQSYYFNIICKKNDGAGNFSSDTILKSHILDLVKIKSSKLNNDNYCDLYLLIEDSYIQIDYIINTANNSFKIQTNAIGFKNNISLKYINADVDNDGIEDILGYNSYSNSLNGKLVWIKNYGDGTFSGQLPLFECYKINQLEYFDLDLDGNKDIIGINNNTGDLVWYKNLGNAIFHTDSVLFTDFFSIQSYAIGDINNDGTNDFVLDNGSEIIYYLNTSGLTFTNSQLINTPINCSIEQVQLKDIDFDGDLDVVYGDISPAIDKVGFSINTGNSSSLFNNAHNLNIGNFSIINFAWEDVDSDSDLDLVVSTTDPIYTLIWIENIDTFMNWSTVPLSYIHIINSIINPNSLFNLIDINSDGKKDILYNANSQFLYQLSDGTGQFNPILQLHSIPLSALFFDADADTDLDMVFFETTPSQNYNNYNLKFKNNLTFDTKTVKGTAFFDQNQNGFKDSSEMNIPYFQISTSSPSLQTETNPFGHYILSLNNQPFGNYTISSLNSDWLVTTSPNPLNLNYNQNYIPITNADFGLYPDSPNNDVQLDLVSGSSKCDNISGYWLTVKNIGNTRPNVRASLKLDDSVTFISTLQPMDSIVGKTIYFHFDSLGFNQHLVFPITVLMPDFNSLGDSIETHANLKLLDQQASIIDSTSKFIKQLTTCAYDPNDKTVSPKGSGNEGFIPSITDKLEYIIRFQNTGNDTATNIVLKDFLSSNLNWTSLKMVSSSHDYVYEVKQDGELIIRFANINLPDSTTDLFASQGYIKYTIKLNENLLPGERILNSARIYFDGNPAIKTNNTTNTINTTNHLTEIEKEEFEIFPNPFNEYMYISSQNFPQEKYKYRIINIQGMTLCEQPFDEMKLQKIDTQKLSGGTYILQIYNSRVNFIYRLVKQ